MSVETIYETPRDCFCLDVWEVLKNHAFSERVRDNHTVGRPITNRSLVIKSIEISRHILSGIGKGLSNPHFRSRHGFLLPQPSQFRMKRLTFCESPGQ